MHGNISLETARQASARRAVAAALLAVGVLASSFRWASEADPVPRWDPSGPVLNMSCEDGETSVDDRRAVVQPQGLVLAVRGATDGDRVTFFPNVGPDVVVSLRSRVDGLAHAQVAPAWGAGLVECGDHLEPTDAAVPLFVASPPRPTHDVDCELARDANMGSRWARPFSARENPLPDAIYRAIPGIRSTDRIEGLPTAPSDYGTGLVIRGDDLAASFELLRYGGTWFIGQMVPCASSGIDEQPEEGSFFSTSLIATPYELAGMRRCDPYTQDCAALYATAAWYERRTGDEVELLAEAPWAACEPSQPYGCPPEPGDAIINVLVEPDQAEGFIARERCGETEAQACS